MATKAEIYQDIRATIEPLLDDEITGKWNWRPSKDTPLQKDELLVIADVFDADVSEQDGVRHIRAMIANAAGLTRGSTAVDFPGPFQKLDLKGLKSRLDYEIEADDEEAEDDG